MKTINLLTQFVNQRPGLDYSNYGEHKAYNQESRKITQDLHDYRELLALAVSRIDKLEEKLKFNLEQTSGRLALKSDCLEYTTGQYFPTEYRPAANRILAQLIFNDYRDEKKDSAKGGFEDVYKDEHEIRKAIKRRVSRRVFNSYFN